MKTPTFALALAATVLLTSAGSTEAAQAKCLAGKNKCVAKKATGLLKCEAAAETPGKSTDPNAGGCVDKVKAKFDGGTTPTKGCFEKLENKSPNDCVTLDDTAAAEAEVDSCVGAFVAAIDPPPLDQTKCGAKKKKCVSKYLKGLLKCEEKAQTPGKSNDPNAGGCVDKAVAKYTGGTDPTKGCFAKLEAKVPSDCQITNDSATLQGLVENCVDDLVDLLESTTTTTSTTTTSTTTTTLAPLLLGALTATDGSFNYNLVAGLPGANSACNSNFAGTHACSITELEAAEANGDLDGLTDIAANTVTSFWAIDNTANPLDQCQDDTPGTGSLLNWEYPTGHTPSRGDWVALDNGTGTLGTLQTNHQCNSPPAKWVGCCL